jgi:hypothetical protein
MALPDSILNVVGTNASFRFRDATDFSPSANSVITEGTPTDVQIDCTSLADDAARQSAKADLGANRAPGFWVRMAVEIAATPTAGMTIDLFWAPSSSGTAAVGNPGAVTGSDAAYSGYSSNLDDSLAQLIRVGTMFVTAQATATVQIAECGYFRPPTRYGSLVVYNRTGAAFHSDMAEFAVVFQPDLPQLQD